MARVRVLNPRAVSAELSALALSREILAEAKAIEEPGQCARLDGLAAQLHDVATERIAGDAARIAFWANLYNALVLHCLCLRPLRGNLLWHLRLFDRIAYRVGDYDFPLNLIENGLLRGNRRPPFRRRRPLRRHDPRLRAAVGAVDPRIHFALNCGAGSCPPIRTYEPESLDSQLDVATAAYIAGETDLDPDRRRVALPRLMRLYRADFGRRGAQLAFAARYLPELRRWLDEDRDRVRVGYGRFDWTVVSAGT